MPSLLSALFASLPDAILATDPQGRVLHLNPAGEALLGVRAQDVHGRDAVEAFVVPEDHERARAWMAQLDAGERRERDLLARLLRADGTSFDAEVGVSPIVAGGRMLGVAGVVRDVTVRRAQDADAALLRAIVGAAAEAIVGVDREGRISFFSPSAESFYGWKADEVLGQPVTLLIAERDMRHYSAVSRALATGRTVHMQGSAKRRDGSLVDAELNASPIMGTDGRQRGSALIVLDISERLRVQQVLDRFIAHVPAVIAVKDLEGRYVLFGERGARDQGRTVEEIIGRTDEQLFGRAVAEPLVAYDREVVATGRSLTHENSYQSDDGTVRTYVTTKFPLFGTGGNVDAVGLIASEVSEVRRAEADRAQLAALVQAAPDAIVARDYEGRVTTWNPGAEMMFGLKAEAAIGRRYEDLIVPPEEREAFESLVAQVEGGRTLTVHAFRMRADGSRFPAQISMAPLTLLDGTWHGTLAMIRDITDLVQAQVELRERAARLERSNADLERFAYAASHDLQEPLQSIRLSAGAVMEAARARLDEDERELLAHIDAAATRLSGQVRGLMEVAQVALGSGPGAHVALAVCVQDTLASLRAAATESAAEIDVQSPLPEIEVPRTEVSAVLQNIVSNAIKYRRPDIAPRITIAAEVAATTVEIRVADNGLGLGSEEAERIFGLFERGRTETTGTGMGLAVSRQLLERLGGTIVAHSEGPGRGTEFTVVVPRNA